MGNVTKLPVNNSGGIEDTYEEKKINEDLMKM